METVSRDPRTSAVVEALVVEGVLGSGRATRAADVIDRVLTSEAPARSSRRSRLPELLGYAGLAIALVGGQLAIFDETTDVLGYTLLGLVGVAGFLLYVARPLSAYLLASVAAVTLVIPQLVADVSEATLGTEGSWLMTAMALLCSTLVAWRLREEHRAPTC
jgi:hypothetical protein